MPKRRPPAADIDAFAAGVEGGTQTPASPQPATEPAAPTARTTEPRPVERRSASPKTTRDAWPDDLARQLLLKYRDPALPLMLVQLAEREDRSQQQMAHRALKRGLEELLREG